MYIKQIPYPVTGKRKFSVFHEGKQYTCYIHPFMSPGFSVFTGNGNNVNCKDITDTKLGTKIALRCRQQN